LRYAAVQGAQQYTCCLQGVNLLQQCASTVSVDILELSCKTVSADGAGHLPAHCPAICMQGCLAQFHNARHIPSCFVGCLALALRLWLLSPSCTPGGGKCEAAQDS
jgi:hypothetical protein